MYYCKYSRSICEIFCMGYYGYYWLEHSLNCRFIDYNSCPKYVMFTAEILYVLAYGHFLCCEGKQNDTGKLKASKHNSINHKYLNLFNDKSAHSQLVYFRDNLLLFITMAWFLKRKGSEFLSGTVHFQRQI